MRQMWGGQCWRAQPPQHTHTSHSSDGPGEDSAGTGSGEPFTTGLVPSPGTDAPSTAVHGAAQLAACSTGDQYTIVELSTVGMLPLIAPRRAATLATDDSVLLIARPVVDGDRLLTNSGAVTMNSIIIVPKGTPSFNMRPPATPDKRRMGQFEPSQETTWDAVFSSPSCTGVRKKEPSAQPTAEYVTSVTATPATAATSRSSSVDAVSFANVDGSAPGTHPPTYTRVDAVLGASSAAGVCVDVEVGAGVIVSAGVPVAEGVMEVAGVAEAAGVVVEAEDGVSAGVIVIDDVVVAEGDGDGDPQGQRRFPSTLTAEHTVPVAFSGLS